MQKTIPATWKTCNCTDFWLPEDDIIRTLLIAIDRRFKSLSKEPCIHSQAGVAIILNGTGPDEESEK